MNGLCSHERLKLALAGKLNADEESTLHHHLDDCELCAAEMERLSGGEHASNEIASMLMPDDLDDALPLREECSTADFVVDHLEPSDDPAVLGRLGGYDVLDIIGRGGMGVVLKGFDRELKRFVAIKALAPHLAHSALARKRFAREAQAAAAVVNLHVIAIHQVQPNGQLPFLVMPLLTGESLAQRLKARGTLELKEILRIGMQAAEGLAAAHGQGLIHRDVKPANILLEKGVERAVLTDFGLARAADDVSMTRQGIIAGTPEYMSPEQARGEALDGRSDLFSLGCVLYEMATGVSPFRTDSTMATLRRIVDEQPAAMASLVPELPPWFCYIVERLLSKDPAQRFASASAVSKLLEECLSHLQQPTSVPLPECCLSLRESSNSFAERKVTLFRRSRLLSILTAIGLAGLLIFAGIVIVLELGKGKLTITSDADDVPIRILKGDDVVESLTVSHAGRTVRLAAGRYQVEIDGNIDGIAVAGDTVTLKRHGAETVRIVRSADPATVHKPDDIPHRVADKPEWGTTRIRVHANGKPVADNAVILGTEGYPGQFLPRLSETPSHRGVISLERLAAGAHWLLVRDNNTVLRIQLPEDVPPIETSLPKYPSLVGKDLDVRVTVGAGKHLVAEAVDSGFGMYGEDTIEFIAVEIHNRTDEAIVVTEANLQLLTAITSREGDARVMSPMWSKVAAGKAIPETTIQPDQTATLQLNWNDWVKRGYWFSRDGEIIAEPHFRFPDSELGRTWVRVMLGNAPPVPVTHPDRIVASESVPGIVADDSLEGVWELAYPPDVAAKRPEEPRLRLVISGDWQGTFQGAQSLSVSRLKVEPQHTPKRIWFGDVDGKPMRGIYEVKEDGLRLMISIETEALPTEFGTGCPEFKRVKGKLADEQLAALKQYSKKAATTATSGSGGNPPRIIGQWVGEDWGVVVLELNKSGDYAGSFTGSIPEKAGTMQLKWSRAENRFNGTWQDGDRRRGELSIRIVDGDIRGSWTTIKSDSPPEESRRPRIKSENSQPRTTRLADLQWARTSTTQEAEYVFGGDLMRALLLQPGGIAESQTRHVLLTRTFVDDRSSSSGKQRVAEMLDRSENGRLKFASGSRLKIGNHAVTILFVGDNYVIVESGGRWKRWNVDAEFADAVNVGPELPVTEPEVEKVDSVPGLRFIKPPKVGSEHPRLSDILQTQTSDTTRPNDEAAAIHPPIEFRIAASKADRDADGVAWFPIKIVEPRKPVPLEESGANLPIEEKLDDNWRGLLWGKTEHTLLADGTWRVVKCDVARSEHSTDLAPSFEIRITLDAVGGALLRRLTGTHLNQSLAIVVDGTIVAAPVLRSEFGEDFVITGTFSKAAAEKLAAAIRKPDLRKRVTFSLRVAEAKSTLAALKVEAASREIRGFEATIDSRLNTILIIAEPDTLKVLQEILDRLDSKEKPHWRKYGVTPAPVSELTAKVLESIGLHLTPISRDRFRAKNVFEKYSGGLDVTFVRSDNGTAGKAGIHEADIVVKLQGRLMLNLADLDAAMQDAAEQIKRKDADSLQFDVLRSGETVRVNVPFPDRQLDQR